VKFIKKIIPSLLILMFLSVVVSAEVVDRIVAVVNEEIVTLSEFNAAFEPYARHIKESYKGPDIEKAMEQNKRMFLLRYVDNILIEQEAKKSHSPIVVKDEEVMSALKDILSKRQTNMDDFVKSLAKEGKTLEMVKKEIKSQMVRMRLLRREVQSKIIVSDEEIGEYYNQHREDYEGKEAVHIKEIFLKYPPKANKAARAQVKNEAVNLRKRIEKGEAFELIAAKYSQGAAASQGGDIGFVERGVVLPELESVIFNIPVGKVSAPIETDAGVYIVAVVDKRGAGLKQLDVVRREIKAKLEEQKLEKKYDEWISSVRSKSYIDIRL
jgi:parvulin-like peptidyl-prolyl isomerase